MSAELRKYCLTFWSTPTTLSSAEASWELAVGMKGKSLQGFLVCLHMRHPWLLSFSPDDLPAQ